jgi:hypothetical protein
MDQIAVVEYDDIAVTDDPAADRAHGLVVQSVHCRHDVKPSATSTPNSFRRHRDCASVTHVRSVVQALGQAER